VCYQANSNINQQQHGWYSQSGSGMQNKISMHVLNGAQLTCLRETVSSLKALTIKTNSTSICNYGLTGVALTSLNKKRIKNPWA